MNIIQNSTPSLSTVLHSIWENNGIAELEKTTITTSDVAILSAWMFLTKTNLSVVDIIIKDGNAIYEGKNKSELLEFETNPTHDSINNMKFSDTKVIVSIKGKTDDRFDQLISIKNILQLATYIKFHIESLLILPDNMRRERINFISKENGISTNEFIILASDFSLIEKYTI